ncbi:MAG TPA: hypothetical protein VKA86_10490 [Candidatus Krumholzibacteria bacterium]|nr:hypothetical protein [Candidatus Krumholzibacteria bacterium]
MSPRARALPVRSTGLHRVLTVLISVLLLGPPAGSGAQESAPRTDEALCQQILRAFSTLETAALQELLAARDVRLNLPGSDDTRRPAADGRFSGEQAAILLQRALRREDPPPAPDLGPDFLRSADGTLCCQCPDFDPEDDASFVVLHFATGRPTSDARGLSGRLYLDLRHDTATGRWTVRAVRELR